ncbi:MAG: ATP-binding protein, partial [Pseudomonadota bacterium]|nr:ATP-binding protein [Pseudomonadota bacterium]
NLLDYNLSQSDLRLVPALRSLVANVAAHVKEVVALEDVILEGRGRLIGLRQSMDDLLDNEIQILADRGLDEPRAQAKTAADEVLLAMQFLVPVFLVAAAVIGFLLIHVIRKPLGMLYRGTLAVTGGDLTYRIAPKANDEFGDLAKQYNAMVEQLQATTVSRDQLEESEGMLQQSVTELRHEIAERERLQRELRRSEVMSAMGSLVAGVAHEVRNPLFGISSTLDAMDARLGGQPEFRRYLDVLQSEVSRLGKLMEDLLSYGRPATDEFVVGLLDSAVAPAVESCKVLAEQLGVSVAVRMDTGGERIRMDQGRLMQVFRNLIDNAIQHAPPGSTVRVEGKYIESAGRRWFACTVTDEGAGFRPEDLPRIFEPFFTRRRGGTGLGLALVQRFVHEHGGEIEARNLAVSGAAVTVRLPVVDA